MSAKVNAVGRRMCGELSGEWKDLLVFFFDLIEGKRKVWRDFFFLVMSLRLFLRYVSLDPAKFFFVANV